jgi:other hect domain ubiquitin protein ligase E3
MKRVLTAINFVCDSMNAEQRVQLDPNARHHRGGGDSDIEIEGSGNEEEQEE